MMTENAKKILVAMGEIGEERLKAADSMEKLQELLEENGVKASLEEIEAALAVGAEAKSPKQELGEEDMENVAGGSVTAAVLAGIEAANAVYLAYKGIKNLFSGKGGDNQGGNNQGGGTSSPAEPDSGSPTNRQTNTNNSKGVQMVNNSGNNNAGGISL